MLAKLKTFFSDPSHIVNALTAASGALIYFQGSELVADNPKLVAGLGTALGVVNILLRLLQRAPATPASDPKAS